MSIVANTLRQLVHNRLHDLCDMALDISADGRLYPCVTIDSSSAQVTVTVRANGSDKMQAGPAAHFRDDNALEQIEELTRWLSEQTAAGCHQAPATP